MLRPTTRELLAATALVVALVGFGCAGDEDGRPDFLESDDSILDGAQVSPTQPEQESGGLLGELVVESSDFGFTLSEPSVPAGAVAVRQKNEGEEPHQVTIVRLEDGQSVADLVAGLEAEGDAFVAPEAYAGGPNGIEPGRTNVTTQELEDGEHALICFIPSADGTPHYAQGMAAPLEVTPNEGTSPEALVDNDPFNQITLTDFTFDWRSDFDGQGILEVVNEGAQAHELTIAQATDGGSVALNGVAAIAPGASALVPVDLPTDTPLTLVCFVTDPTSGQTHVALGMQQEITISSG